jgi:hypothetical protein
VGSPDGSILSRARAAGRFVPLLFLAVLPTIVISNVAVRSPAAKAASYDYVSPQVAPPIAGSLEMAEIAAILNETAPNSPYLVAYQLTTTDENAAKSGLAPLKVVPTDDAAHPYLGVFHDKIGAKAFATYLSYSRNLRTWHTLGQIHGPASQPDIRILPDDSVLYAEEYNPRRRPFIRVQYYATSGITGLQALIANPAVAPSNAINLPETPLAKADGTPEFGRIGYSGSIADSTVEITHHYFHLGHRDLPAAATLRNFESWSSSTDTVVDGLVTNAGGNGKIGDREIFKVGSQVFELVEAQVDPASADDYGSWRLFLIDRTTSAIRQLNPVLAGGAQSLGNPTVSFVTLPPPTPGAAGAPALVFTCFVFGARNGTTPAGGHIFVYPLP